jgi:hypothetical protein
MRTAEELPRTTVASADDEPLAYGMLSTATEDPFERAALRMRIGVNVRQRY